MFGESKRFRVSVYRGSGVPELATFGRGTLIGTLTLPTNGIWDRAVDVTDLLNEAVSRGDDLLRIRIREPAWTGVQNAAATLDLSAGLESRSIASGTAPLRRSVCPRDIR